VDLSVADISQFLYRFEGRQASDEGLLENSILATSTLDAKQAMRDF